MKGKLKRGPQIWRSHNEVQQSGEPTMKTKSTFRALLLLALLTVSNIASAQGTAFTYQGRLGEGGSPAHGSYDFRFVLYDLETGGGAVSGAITNAATLVGKGLFTVTLDFGAGVFTGAERWLEIGVSSYL